MAAVSPPHSPPPARSSPSSPGSPYQHLADADHCFLPSSQHSTSPVLPSRTRSGSRTYDEAQADDRQHLARRRTRSRERAAAEDALVGRKSSSEHAAPGAYEHAGDEMSAHELRAEMETLMLLRRRSMSQPVADPDLPPTAPPTSAPPIKRPNLTLAIPTINEHPGGGPVSPTAPSPAETGTLVRRRSTVGGRLPSEHPLPSPPPVPSPALQFPHSSFSSPSSSSAESDELSSSPASFWLPASLHPELAPAEFKAFIREQTRPEALARRTSLSAGGGGPGSGAAGANHGGVGPGGAPTGRPTRRASLLRGEYKPRANDGVGDERREQPPPVPRIDEEHLVKRTTSDGAAAKQRRSRNTLNFEELTIKDLQRLEELAAKAEAEGNTEGEEEEGERLGRVLRRSLSLNPHRVAAAAAAAGTSFGGGTLASTAEEPAGTDAEGSEPSLDSHDGASVDDEEAPIIVFAPGQILRRNARTKIRKTSIGGTETTIGFSGGSRYGSGRRKGGRSSTGDTSVETGESGGTGGGGEGPLTASSEGGEAGEAGDSASPPSSDQQHIEVATLPVDDGPHVVVQQQHPPALPPKSEQAPLPTVVVDRPTVDASLPPPVPAPRPPYPSVDTPAPVVPPPGGAVEPTSPTSPTRNAISPASAEYDWATHHQPAPPPPPPPAPEPQYTVHPQHLPRQPFGEVPPPQAVPIPLPQQRKEPPAPSPPPPAPAPAPARSQSPKPAPKEKKSGWARLGLGRDDDKKRKGKGRDRSDDGASTTSASSHGSGGGGDKESSGGGGGSGFLSGIFGRSKRGGSAEHEPPAPPRAPSPPPEPRIPPPPPTASGVLLPNGRYANFYRLPIHVERAVYRLSHIKLANPRRPLYEQVLISNLMFWYLGLIQKPVAPPPAVAPVPIPGLPSPSPNPSPSLPNGLPASPSPHDASPASSSAAPSAPVAVGPPPSSPSQPHKRGGLSKPSRAAAGARPAAEMPMRTVSYEVQNQQLLVEEQRERYHQQHQQLGQGPPPGQGQGQYSAPPSSQQQGYAAPGSSGGGSSSRSSPSRSLFAPPLSSTSAATGPDPAQQQRSPERASAPAALYAGGAADDDDDRPLALAQHAQQQPQPYSTRESFPPTRGAVQVPPASSSARPGFEVTSRRVSGGSITSAEHAYGGGYDDGGVIAHHDPALLASSSAAKHERRASAMSDRSFDAGEIYDAYAPGSPGLVSGPGASSLFGPPPSSSSGAPAVALETPPGAVLGAVAPRGSSLRALSR
ncbi:uncharacterized protein RHOBADRAFT_54003 [Rhodotorula graminis WP1]|uniref:Protein Zds1 C-terminal domain-containing protein n=1 Tax=Rhodotorula graminis (strain WP1) TaxID=578459 RepID=A0A194S0K7_RHOGW|nr:uncharacterized protein RHOBADRAFT_54003 [Rhodotorula graminis WP1]KPV74142.1 hypothetical protein RHOBADRAFT_54003 [Rhodotorula graminis WP1]